MLVVGIDENGLGPILGPMIVTAAAFETEDYQPTALWDELANGFLTGDSKDIYSKAKLATAEASTLRWLAAFEQRPAHFRALCEAITLPAPFPMPCKRPNLVCDPAEIKLPNWAAATPEEDSTEPLHRSRPRHLAAFSICPGGFNSATANGTNKFQLDFNLMMALIAHMKKNTDQEILAVCGKIGSTKKYEPWISAAGYPLTTILEESAPISSYRVAGLGTISFVRDADSLHLPVAVASMVGKYLRELAMCQVNLLLGEPDGKTASGYRDPVTKGFIQSTEPKRRALKLPDSCFLRNS